MICDLDRHPQLSPVVSVVDNSTGLHVGWVDLGVVGLSITQCIRGRIDGGCCLLSSLHEGDNLHSCIKYTYIIMDEYSCFLLNLKKELLK